jgi:hypothetical protein
VGTYRSAGSDAPPQSKKIFTWFGIWNPYFSQRTREMGHPGSRILRPNRRLRLAAKIADYRGYFVFLKEADGCYAGRSGFEAGFRVL